MRMFHIGTLGRYVGRPNRECAFGRVADCESKSRSSQALGRRRRRRRSGANFVASVCTSHYTGTVLWAARRLCQQRRPASRGAWARRRALRRAAHAHAQRLRCGQRHWHRYGGYVGLFVALRQSGRVRRRESRKRAVESREHCWPKMAAQRAADKRRGPGCFPHDCAGAHTPAAHSISTCVCARPTPRPTRRLPSRRSSCSATACTQGSPPSSRTSR